MPIQTPSSPWSVTDLQTAGIATATKAAEAGKSHYVTMALASMESGAAKRVQLKDGTTVLATWYATFGAPPVPFDPPLKITQAALVSLNIAAGEASVDGMVSLFGFTEEE